MEIRLRELMEASGKTRFGLVWDDEPSCCPCENGYVISLNPDHPHNGCIYLHEFLHGILMEEGYPTAVTASPLPDDEETAQILWSFTNCIHHIEIFRRMQELGADMEQYLHHRFETLRGKLEPVIRAGDAQFVNRHEDALVLFDTYLMSKYGQKLRDRYATLATTSLDICDEIYARMAGRGCDNPEAARDWAKAYQEVMVRRCATHGVSDNYKRFWAGIGLVPVAKRSDLLPCPERAGTLDNLAPLPAPPAAPAPPVAP